MTTMIELSNVTCAFGEHHRRVVALDRVDLDVPAGTFVAVMGPTGSGKSTLLNCAATLDRPSAGTVRVAGRDTTAMNERDLARLRRQHVGFVFQSYNLLSELTVTQNVLLPCRLGAGQRRTLVDVLGAVGLDGAEDRSVGELSGGQRQRVAVARALVTAPDVIFADEPTGALDPQTGRQILALLREAVDRDGATVVMVSHDPLAAAYSDRLVLLRSGRVVADGATPCAATIAAQVHAAAVPAMAVAS